MNPKFGYKYSGNRIVKCENEQLIMKAILMLIESGFDKKDIIYMIKQSIDYQKTI